MDKSLAKKYEEKIIENLDKESFEEVEDVVMYKRESKSHNEAVYSVGDLYLEIVSSTELGWVFIKLDLEFDEYEFESKLYNEVDNSEDKLQKLFRNIDDLNSFIRNFYFYGYNIIPNKDTLVEGE